jgi:carboxymethylenebutenolidase
LAEEPSTISRREFTALSIAAGVAAATGATGATGASGAGAIPLAETDVQVATPAGLCDAALIHPQDGSWPGVILFTDVFGLRPTMRGMARRLAAGGFTVLVPNPFYRTSKPPGLPLDIDFNNPADRAKIDSLRAPLTGDAVMQDAAAYVTFLDSQAAVERRLKMGVFGYCMGGPMTLQAAAAVPDRIGAGASFHGGGLVTDKPDSPHHLGVQDEGTVLHRHRRERRSAAARCQIDAERCVQVSPFAREDRGLRRLPAWLVREGHAAEPRQTAHIQ